MFNLQPLSKCDIFISAKKTSPKHHVCVSRPNRQKKQGSKLKPLQLIKNQPTNIYHCGLTTVGFDPRPKPKANIIKPNKL